jgi:nucleoside-diphosphate-sugar epimerase
MADGKTALILGATGGIGGELARQMCRDGWHVRALTRRPPGDAARRDGVDWLAGDAMDRDAVVNAARGASAIVHAVNPPGYQRWAELVLPMLDNSIAAARASGARILLPGTVYNHGPDAFPLLGEDSPQRPLTRKGAIRVEMERRLRAAAGAGVRSLIVRAGDFFGPRAANSWFSQGLVTPGRAVRTVTRPGRPGVGHAWAYLPDVACTMLRLLDRADALDDFARFHMAGHWDADGTQMVEAIRRVVQAAGMPAPRVRGFPWWLLPLAGPFVPVLREMKEMRYLWREPVRLDNTRLLGVLGGEPHTPLDDAVRTTLAGLGCLAASPVSRADAVAGGL